MPARLKERYEREVKPELIKRFGYKSPMQSPKVEKITVNMGVGDAKLNTAMLDAAGEQLAVITGQKPSVRRARKSIANFKLRAGMPVGVKVTLRHERMYEMLDRLQSIAIPRIRDFRGLNPRSFDGRGNYSLGIKEQIIFPEVNYDAIDQVRGLDVTITTTAESDEEARELLRLLGMPFRSDGGGSSASGAAAAEQQDGAGAEPSEGPSAESGEEPGEEFSEGSGAEAGDGSSAEASEGPGAEAGEGPRAASSDGSSAEASEGPGAESSDGSGAEAGEES